MTVDPAAPRGGSYEYQDVEYFFCNPKCNERFRSEPEKYLSPDYQPGGMILGLSPVIPLASLGSADPANSALQSPTSVQASKTSSMMSSPASPTAASSAYVCPMCPEVRAAKPGACPIVRHGLGGRAPTALRRARNTSVPCIRRSSQEQPGSCPKCGMSLEPRTVSSAEAVNPELIDMMRRLRVSVAFGVPLLVLGMLHMATPLLHTSMNDAWLQLLLASPVVLWGGFPFFERAVASIKFRSPNMFTLIGMGVGVSYLYSALATFLPSLFPDAARHARAACFVF